MNLVQESLSTPNTAPTPAEWIVYVNRVLEFASYKDTSYPFVGLISELGELYQAIMTEQAIDVVKELGDVYWMIAALCRERGCDINVATITCLPRKSSFIYAQDAIQFVVSETNLPRFEARLLRGDTYNPSPYTDGSAIIRVMGFLSAIARNYNVSFLDIATQNYRKLSDRRQKGSIMAQSEGDRD